MLWKVFITRNMYLPGQAFEMLKIEHIKAINAVENTSGRLLDTKSILGKRNGVSIFQQQENKVAPHKQVRGTWHRRTAGTWEERPSFQ